MDSEAPEREAGAANDGSAKRRQIMDGARQVFLSAGFDSASMNDVARAAGVSKGTLYAYFNSKEHLFEAIIRAEKAQSAERVCRFLHDRGDVRAVLADFGVRLLELMTDPGALKLARVVVAAADNSPASAGHSTRSGPSMARRGFPTNCGRSRSGARSRCPTPSAQPGSSSISARAMFTNGSCLASSIRSVAKTSKPRSRPGSMYFSKLMASSPRGGPWLTVRGLVAR